ncbi:SIR2 family NAD-dependent protein deacylase [Gemella cuniculi]|uniref:SIR2 family NAD-dependent protein deacylase n=1 Tax=Gemella cuniculi TaxID=150240 RepID=UPI0003FFEA53|nr:Sir2 family NAD-dependent protein deacetylase [Gemella cuniculi]
MKNNIELAKKLIQEADVVLIGAGAGLSTAAGLSYDGERFEKNFSEFIKRYGMNDMYSAGFYPFETSEEKWGYWSKHIYLNRYEDNGLELYRKLFDVVKEKEYFIITTNVDSQFEKVGFDKQKIFEVQGNYGEFQCSAPCHDEVYNNKDQVFRMLNEQKNLKIPSELIPKCPVCGDEMTTHLRVDNLFVETKHWHKQIDAYYNFLENNKDKKIVMLELGVGFNTPTIIRFPFERLNKILSKATLIRVNKEKFEVENVTLITDNMSEVFETWKS